MITIVMDENIVGVWKNVLDLIMNQMRNNENNVSDDD